MKTYSVPVQPWWDEDNNKVQQSIKVEAFDIDDAAFLAIQNGHIITGRITESN